MPYKAILGIESQVITEIAGEFGSREDKCMNSAKVFQSTKVFCSAK